jgi:hypothetical protein
MTKENGNDKAEAMLVVPAHAGTHGPPLVQRAAGVKARVVVATAAYSATTSGWPLR